MIESIKDILASDLLNRYVAGDVSTAERIKVDILSVDHREIRERIRHLEMDMEISHLNQAMTPPAGTKECVIKALNPKAQSAAANPEVDINRSTLNMSWLMAAASFFIGAVIVGFGMQPNLSKANEQNERLNAELTILKEECKALNAKYAFMNSSETLPVVLENIDSKEAQAIVYWNAQEQASLLKILDLPNIRADQTFQIWADVDNEMLSVGTFNKTEELVALGYFDGTTSLNITIEPKGGSTHPTLTTLTANKVI